MKKHNFPSLNLRIGVDYKVVRYYWRSHAPGTYSLIQDIKKLMLTFLNIFMKTIKRLAPKHIHRQDLFKWRYYQDR